MYTSDFPAFKKDYEAHVAERLADSGLPPKPLTEEQTNQVVDALKSSSTTAQDKEWLVGLLSNRVPAGVDKAAYWKAHYLADVALGEIEAPCASLPKQKCVELLGQMMGGFNVEPLVKLLQSDDATLADEAATALSQTLLVFDAFNDVAKLAEGGCQPAARVMKSWAEAEWFTNKPALPEKMTITVFKVPGETNTDDLSPAPDAWSRPDIPKHALAMLPHERPGVDKPLETIAELKKKGHIVAYVGDVVGTGSSRKSATNSILWHTGEDIPGIPNRRAGGVCIGGKIAPIFFNTMEDSGALPLEMDVSQMETGDVVDIYPFEGIATKHGEKSAKLAEFSLKSQVLPDEVRAGGRIPLIIGRALTAKARTNLNLPATDLFKQAPVPEKKAGVGYTLAQKMVGRACGADGVVPGQYCEPQMSSVGSQDTTGPMTRDELKDLACLGFGADLVMQSFCHTAAYPKPVDLETHRSLPDFMTTRGGVALRPGDGIIHSWLNRMLLPDGVGTGGDSHTRFPLGISFPAGSGFGRLRGGNWSHATRHARVRKGPLHRYHAARHYTS